MCFALTFLPYDLPVQDAKTLAERPWKTRSAAALSYGQQGTEPPGAGGTVGYFGPPVGAAYLLYRPDFSRRVTYLRPASKEDFLESLARGRMEAVFAPLPHAERAAYLDDALRAGRLGPAVGRFHPVR